MIKGIRFCIFAVGVTVSFVGCNNVQSPAPTRKIDSSNSNSSAKPDSDKNTIEEEKSEDEQLPTNEPTPVQVFSLSSSAFADNGAIPLKYAANGQGGNNLSPPLVWGNAPSGTGSIAIQMTDLDSLQGGNPRVHWVITDISANQTGLPENVPGGNNLASPPQALGANQVKDYGGPNPPEAHRYQWTVYAIRVGETLMGLTNNNSAVNKTELEAKAVATSVITGVFDPSAN